MANKFKRSGIYYIQYKEGKNWKQFSCGRGVGRDEAEVIRKKYDAMELNNRHQMNVIVINTTLLEQLDHYIKNEIPHQNNGRPRAQGTIRRYQDALNNFKEYVEAGGWERFNEITDDTMAEFIKFLYENGHSGASVAIIRITIMAFYRWAISKNFTSHNPAAKTVAPVIEKKAHRFYSYEELDTIFENANGVYKNIFKFLYYTGIRVGELQNATWSDFNPALGLLTIKVQDGNKRKRELILPLNDEALAILSEQKRNLLKINTPDAMKYLFVNGEGRKLDNANVYRNLKVILNNNNIEGATVHTFRHTFGSHLVIQGASLHEVRDLMGHKSIEETEIYAHLSQAAQRKASNLLSRSAQPSFNSRQFKAQGVA